MATIRTYYEETSATHLVVCMANSLYKMWNIYSVLYIVY